MATKLLHQSLLQNHSNVQFQNKSRRIKGEPDDPDAPRKMAILTIKLS